MTAVVLTGEAIQIHRANVIRAALKLYATHRIQANRAYTPKNMLEAAASITGKKYPRGYYDTAILDLQEWINARLATRT